MSAVKFKATKSQVEKHIGREPEAGSTLVDLLSAYNHYNYFYSRQDAVSFLTLYLKDANPDILSAKDVSGTPTTYGWIARMKSRQIVLPDVVEEKFSAFIENLPNLPEIEPAKVVKKVVNHNRVASFAIAQLENMVDAAFEGKYESPLNVLRLYNNKEQLNVIREFYAPLLAELQSKDPEVVEAYRHVPVKHFNLVVRFLIELLNFTQGIKTVVKKPAKAVDANNEFGIYDSPFVVLYNPSNLIAVIFEADVGLNMDGTLLDGVKSSHFTNIKNTETFLKEIKKGGYAECLKVMEKCGDGLKVNKYRKIAKAHNILRK